MMFKVDDRIYEVDRNGLTEFVIFSVYGSIHADVQQIACIRDVDKGTRIRAIVLHEGQTHEDVVRDLRNEVAGRYYFLKREDAVQALRNNWAYQLAHAQKEVEELTRKLESLDENTADV